VVYFSINRVVQF